MCLKMGENPSPNKKPKLSDSTSEPDDSGILNERVLLLVFSSLKWDIHTLCITASVSRKLRALARRLLWRELCLYRARRMISTITELEPTGRLIGGWLALAKLLFFCGGCESTSHFEINHSSPGHFVKSTRFSKTSGRSFLTKRCRGDVLFVSDPCEHAVEEKQDDVGIFRGVFGGFMKSKTRECLIRRQVEFEEKVRCAYCGARVWSMTKARLIARRSAARRLGSSDDGLEYFVCLNGHLHGTCWLVPLSDEDGVDEEEEEDESDERDDDEDGVLGQVGSNGCNGNGNYRNGC